MFKHVIRKKAGKDESESESDPELSDKQVDSDDEEALGSDGDEEVSGSEGDEEENEDESDDDDEDDEEEEEDPPENLPGLDEAIEKPVFELTGTDDGKKGFGCAMCPDKLLREGKMTETHLSSKAHKRRLARYTEYLKAHPELSEQTSDPRKVVALLDGEIRLRKAGLLEQDRKPRASKRNKKKSKDGAATKNPADDIKGDGIGEVAGMKALNAKQKRKLKQQERAEAEEQADSSASEDDEKPAKKSKTDKKPNGAERKKVSNHDKSRGSKAEGNRKKSSK